MLRTLENIDALEQHLNFVRRKEEFDSGINNFA